MKTRPLQNYGASVGLEAYDIDWNNQEECQELGRLCAQECVVFVDQPVPLDTLYNTMTSWGDPSRALLHEYITEKRIQGRHWREILINLGYISNEVGEEMTKAVSIVSYKKGEKNRPKGIFQNGELDWHSDQCSIDDAQRMIGLMSISDSENSQTQFMCTHDAYEGLSSDMRSMVKELVVKHKWREGLMAPGLNKVQGLIIQYNMVPLNGMETKLYRETATGLSGMKLPSHTFDGFVGMTFEESKKVLNVLHQASFKEKYVYTHDWKDGQLVFMDQEITLHKRPTNIQDGSLRTMARTITYLNKIFPENKRTDTVRYNGKVYPIPEFVQLVDKSRKQQFEKEQQGAYTSLTNEVYYDGSDISAPVVA